METNKPLESGSHPPEQGERDGLPKEAPALSEESTLETIEAISDEMDQIAEHAEDVIEDPHLAELKARWEEVKVEIKRVDKQLKEFRRNKIGIYTERNKNPDFPWQEQLDALHMEYGPVFESKHQLFNERAELRDQIKVLSGEVVTRELPLTPLEEKINHLQKKKGDVVRILKENLSRIDKGREIKEFKKRGPRRLVYWDSDTDKLYTIDENEERRYIAIGDIIADSYWEINYKPALDMPYPLWRRIGKQIALTEAIGVIQALHGQQLSLAYRKLSGSHYRSAQMIYNDVDEIVAMNRWNPDRKEGSGRYRVSLPSVW